MLPYTIRGATPSCRLQAGETHYKDFGESNFLKECSKEHLPLREQLFPGKKIHLPFWTCSQVYPPGILADTVVNCDLGVQSLPSE